MERCSSSRTGFFVLSLLACGVVGCAPAAPPPPSETPRAERPAAPAGPAPTWTWPDDKVGEFWRRLHAGKSLKPTTWPNGATVAVALSFDYQMGSIYEPNPAASTSTNSEYDGRVGLPRILATLDKHQVPASFFTTGVTAAFFPETLRLIMASGRHEIGVHGWIHERTTDVPADDEKRLLQKAVDAIEKVTGKKPAGYRSPSWEFSAHTVGFLRELGFLYDSGMMADDDPYEIVAEGQPIGLVEIPVEWVRDDAMYYVRQGPQTPDDFFGVMKAEFDKAYEEHGLFQVTMHPRISGHRSRALGLDRFIAYLKTRPGVWFATHEEVARHVRQGISTPPR